MNRKKSFKAVMHTVIIPVVISMVSAGIAWAAPPVPGAENPAAQLNRERQRMEQKKIEEQIKKGKQSGVIKSDQSKPEEDSGIESVTFVLKEVALDPSVILRTEELAVITEKFVDQTVSLQDLYKLTEEINTLYETKGYMTCRAYLPPQRISGGVVRIRLLEGKTGSVTVEGNKHTKEKFVRSRLPLVEGEISNTDRLSRDILRFNAMENAQIEIVMNAGTEESTTDYKILVYEPKKNFNFNFYMDNNGYDTTGMWREGLVYTNYSLTGKRDALSLNYIHTKGTNAGSLGYSTPIGKKGTKLDLDFNLNSTKITSGELEAMQVKGRGHSFGFALRHPLLITERKRVEGGLRYLYQKSHSDFLDVPWVDDKTHHIIPYISFVNYGDSSVFYHKHSLDFGKCTGLDGKGENHMIYSLNSIYQKRYGHGQLLKARLDGQMSTKDYLSSGLRFYIGGANSVRGYKESLLSGDKGIFGSMEYQLPLDKKERYRLFTFLDYGTVFGDSAFDDNKLVSTGFGVTASYRNIYAGVTLGVPLIKNINAVDADSVRVHFMLNAMF